MSTGKLSRQRVDDIVARFERRVLGRDLSSEERIRRVVRAAKHELVPDFVRCMQTLPPEMKLANAYSLFVMARDALYYQEIQRGLQPAEAMRAAAMRLLNNDAW